MRHNPSIDNRLGRVNALEVFDGGSGPRLIAGGIFTTAGGQDAFYIAQWDGKSWSPVGGGVNEPVWSLKSFDDGNGPAVFAGGTFLVWFQYSAHLSVVTYVDGLESLRAGWVCSGA